MKFGLLYIEIVMEKIEITISKMKFFLLGILVFLG